MRTFMECRDNSSFSSMKSDVSSFPDVTMTLSDLLQVRRCQTSPCYVIEEDEEPSDMDIDIENGQHAVRNSKTDHILTERNNNNINEQTQTCQVKTDTLVSNNCDNVTSSTTSENNVGELICNSDSVRSSSKRLASCRRKLPQFSTPATSELSSSSPSTPAINHRTSSEVQIAEQNQISDRNHSEIKSGHLVIISADQNQNRISSTLKCTSGINTRTQSLSRYPVLVKIHKKSYERYAIITRTRRHQTSPSIYLKLKNSRVTQLSTNPSHFVVVVDGTEGKSFHFEASSPDSAREWIRAFSSDNACCRNGSPTHRLTHMDQFSYQDSNPSGAVLENSPRCLQTPATESTFPSPVLKIPRSPALPVLSETTDELEECEE